MPSTRTRLTKTGQPVMGTPIEVHHTDDTWEKVTVVGKGVGTDGRTLVFIAIEYDDGSRAIAQPFSDLVWRSVGADDQEPERQWQSAGLSDEMDTD